MIRPFGTATDAAPYYAKPCNERLASLPEALMQLTPDGYTWEHAYAKGRPEYALTLTVPALMSAPWLYCVVPARSKAWAVKQTLLGPVTDQVPATVLRLQPNAVLYLEKESACLL